MLPRDDVPGRDTPPVIAADVLVVGSTNRDYIVETDRYPEAGETVLATTVHVGSGGKGANQAVAAARTGAVTAFVGAVGGDANGTALLADLRAAGVDTSAVLVADVPSGMAFITVTPDGENRIVVAAGAGAALQPGAAVAAVRARLGAATVVVMQAEIPQAVVDAVAAAAAGGGHRVVLNLAPYRPIPEATLAACDPLVVNEGEAGALLQRAVASVADARAAAAALARRCRSVVITLGARGAVLAAGTDVTHLAAATVTAVDTTGAGDAFIGALAARLAAGDTLTGAAHWGTAAAGIAVTRPGAQTSYPSRDEVLARLRPAG